MAIPPFAELKFWKIAKFFHVFIRYFLAVFPGKYNMRTYIHDLYCLDMACDVRCPLCILEAYIFMKQNIWFKFHRPTATYQCLDFAMQNCISLMKSFHVPERLAFISTFSAVSLCEYRGVLHVWSIGWVFALVMVSPSSIFGVAWR